MSKSKSIFLAASATRREFAKTLAAVAAAPLVARAQQATPARPRPPETPPAAEPPSAAAEALAEVVRTRHGKHLSDAQLEQVKRSIDRSLRNADRLKQFKLKNGDEPAFAFTADIQ